jgi:hypothetical protein
MGPFPDVPVTCDAADVRDFAREAGRRSLPYFLASVLGLRLGESFISSLNGLPLRMLVPLAEGILLWARLRGVRSEQVSRDSISWLYPELREDGRKIA